MRSTLLVKALLSTLSAQITASPANAQKPSEFNAYSGVFDVGTNSSLLRREDVSCVKKTGATIYVNCKTKYQQSYSNCGHGDNLRIHYLSFGDLTNPVCPAALYFDLFDDLEGLPEAND